MSPPNTNFGAEEAAASDAIVSGGDGRISSSPPLRDASDASALVMIALIFFLLGCFIIGAWVLVKRERRGLSAEARLLEEVGADSDDKTPEDDGWERPGDWWRHTP